MAFEIGIPQVTFKMRVETDEAPKIITARAPSISENPPTLWACGVLSSKRSEPVLARNGKRVFS